MKKIIVFFMSMVMAIMLAACNENDGYKEKYEKLLSETEANGTSTEESIAEPSNTESIREESNKLIESKVEESTKTTNDNSTYVIHSSSENDKYETKSKFADVFIENLNKYKKIINEYSDKTQDLKSRLGNNFNIYVNNGQCHRIVDKSKAYPKKNIFIKVPITAL